MRINQSYEQALTLGAVGVGLLLARSLRKRPLYNFSGKSVLITGSSRGLGLILARQLVREDARVSLLARDPDELHRAADNIRSRHPRANVITIQADVRQRADVESAVAQSVDRYGRLDVLINNAGIIQAGPLDHMTLADYEDAMDTHFWGPLYTVLAALPYMRSQAEGRIVNISSIGGRVAVPHMLPYAASKFALVGLSDGLRAELAHENITVTTVCPGLMRTGSAVNALFKGKHAHEYAWFAILGSLPLSSINAERAGRKILAACRRGDAELIITVQAHAAVLARALAPELVADVMSVMNRLLPSADGPGGNVARPGKLSESAWAPSALTAATYKAARQNNEL